MSFHVCPRDDSCNYCRNGTSAKLKKSIQDCVDHVICICLKDRPDRLKESSIEFHRTGLCQTVLYYRPEKPSVEEIRRVELKLKYKFKSIGAYGCWQSHHVLAMYLRAINCNRALIIEDDILFKSVPDFEFISTQLKQLDLRSPTWTHFYLGHCPLWSSPCLVRGTVLVKSFLTHCYILNRDFIDRLAETPFYLLPGTGVFGTEHGIDAFFMMYGKQYALYPMIAVQSPSQSSITPPCTVNVNIQQYIIRYVTHNFHKLYSHIETAAMVWPAVVLLLLSTVTIAVSSM